MSRSRILVNSIKPQSLQDILLACFFICTVPCVFRHSGYIIRKG
uniref:Uncharacterized protein n=1 Tax=Arundo donax TaxID=35708 RepID=A0A0A9ATQ2_ARUDO